MLPPRIAFSHTCRVERRIAMNVNDDCRAYAKHLRIEHSRIDLSLEELQHLIANTAQWSKENPAPALLAGLVQLREQLAHHFREEEEGGCTDEAQSRSLVCSRMFK